MASPRDVPPCRLVLAGAALLSASVLPLASCGDDDAPPADAAPPPADLGAPDGAEPLDAGPADGGASEGGRRRDAGPFPGTCPAVGPIEAQLPAGDTDACALGLLTTGFGLRWKNLNHRLSRWAVGPLLDARHAPTGCPSASGSRGAALAVDFVGGSFTTGSAGSDEGIVRYGYAVVGADLAPDADAPAFLRGSVPLELDPSMEARVTVEVDLAAAGLAARPELAVVLDGLELRTDVPQGPDYPADYDPALGYTSRGVGAGIEDVTRAGDRLSFVGWVRFAHGVADRDDMNRAIPVARTRAVLGYQLVALDVPPATGRVAYRETYPMIPLLDRSSVCHPAPELTAVEVAGSPGHAHAALGLSRFDLRFWPELAGGDYVREISVSVRDVALDATRGRVRATVEAYATNESATTLHGMDYEAAVDVVLLQWDGAAAVTGLALVAPVPVGESELALPMSP